MAKLSESALQILFALESGVSVTRSGWGRSESWMIAPGRGQGHKSNPRASVGNKLLDNHMITDNGRGTMALADKGREALVKARRDGWDVVIGTGDKIRVVQNDNA